MHKKINAILIPLVMLALLAAFFLLPSKDFSERENRYLAPLPKLSVGTVTDGSFMEDIKDYVSDHFPFRDFWIGVNTRVGLLRGKTLINGVYFADDDYIIEKYEPSGNMSKIAKVVNDFADKVDAKVTFMAVPTSVVINRDRLPAGTDGDADAQLAELGELYADLNCYTIDLTEVLSERNRQGQVFYRLDHHWTNAGALAGYEEYYELISTMEDHMDPLHIYREHMRMMASQMPTPGLISNTHDLIYYYDFAPVSDSFRGTLFNKVGECGLGFDSITSRRLPDTVLEKITIKTDDGKDIPLFDESKLETADQYAYFLSGNHPFLTITNAINVDRTVYITPQGPGLKEYGTAHFPDILIIKDSYANCMIPLMLGDYHSITVIDPRYYADPISDYVNEHGIDEVLFVYNMNMLGTDLGIRRIK